MKKNILVVGISYIGFWLIFFVLQNPVIYENTLGKISFNYQEQEDGGKIRVKKPYEGITNSNMLHWDAEHYYYIKENGYKESVPYLYAFFPLFPFIWKISDLSPVHVIILNSLLFITGLLLLASLFKVRWKTMALLLSIPMLMAVTTIPYTEATFFLMFSLAAVGFMKNKYWLYFIGIVLASMTRNTLLLLFLAVICTEIIFFFKEKNIKQSLKRVFLYGSPVIVGTLLVSLIQFIQGSDKVFKFIEVQKYWQHSLSLPNLLRLEDWSHEGFCVHIPILVMVAIPLLIYLLCIFLKHVDVLKKDIPFLNISSQNKEDYFKVILVFCCMAAVSSVMLTQHGNLHGLGRFVLCSPYFFILILLFKDQINAIPASTKHIALISLSILSLLIFVLMPYSRGFSIKFIFLYTGFIIFILFSWLYCFSDKERCIGYKVLLFFNLGFNLLWSTYLFNVFLSDGWIFI